MDLQANVAGKRGKSGKAKTVGTVLAQGVAGESHREKEPRYTPDSGAGAVAYLFLRRLPSGRQNWVVIRRMAGAASPVTVTIGRKDSMSLRDARRAAEIVNGQMARGENPNATKKAARAAEHAKVAAKRAATVHTLLAVGRAFIQHCEVGTRQRGPRAPATVAEYRRKLQNDIPEKWHPRPLAGISADEVKGLIGTMGERAPVAANRLFEFLNATFNYAVTRKILPANPLDGEDRGEVLFREKSRRRSLVHPLTGDLSEVVALWRGVETIEPEHHPFRALVKMLLLTGARVGTFARAHPGQTDAILWCHIKDLDKPEHARIEVPSVQDIRKSGDDGDEGYTIALSPAAVAVLDGLAKVSDSAPVFTMDGKTPIKIDHPQRDQMRALANKAAGRELAHFTLHDLRRTVSTGLGHLGCPQPVNDAALDHAGEDKRGVAGIYNRAQLFAPCKDWLTKWADHLGAALKA
jgi:integrase